MIETMIIIMLGSILVTLVAFIVLLLVDKVYDYFKCRNMRNIAKKTPSKGNFKW